MCPLGMTRRGVTLFAELEPVAGNQVCVLAGGQARHSLPICEAALPAAPRRHRLFGQIPGQSDIVASCPTLVLPWKQPPHLGPGEA